jgi:hypothetical protein
MLVFLLWRLVLFGQGVPLVALLVLAASALAHWAFLSGEHISIYMRRTLVFLTGPSILLTLLLISRTTVALNTIAMLNGAPKGLGWALENDAPVECQRQWVKDQSKKMKSERLLYVVLLASICLLYSSRLTSAKRERTMCKDRGKRQLGAGDDLL